MKCICIKQKCPYLTKKKSIKILLSIFNSEDDLQISFYNPLFSILI